MGLKTTQTVFVTDLAPAGFCCAGARRLAQCYGIDWQAFVHYGIAIDTLAAFDDPQINRLIKWAEKRNNA
jgi:hypothetical protein